LLQGCVIFPLLFFPLPFRPRTLGRVYPSPLCIACSHRLPFLLPDPPSLRLLPSLLFLFSFRPFPLLNATLVTHAIRTIQQHLQCPITSDQIQLCSGCRTASYCSEWCQADDWPRHREECRASWRLRRGECFSSIRSAFGIEASTLESHLLSRFPSNHLVWLIILL
jgi:MYND finger